MKVNKLKNINWMRLLYLLIGFTTAIMAFMDNDWLFVVVGIGIGLMGIFRLGCAGRNCTTTSCEIPAHKDFTSSKK